MAHIRGTNLNNSGLILSADARNTKCYSGSGSTLNNLKRTNIPLTLQNSPTYTSSCKFTMNGTNQYISIPQDSRLENQQFTINIWCKLTGLTGSKYIFQYGNGSTLSKGITIWSDAGDITFSINSYNTNTAVYSGFSDTTNVHNWTFTYDGSNLKIYLDGTLQDTQSETSSVDYTGITSCAIFSLTSGASNMSGEFNSLQIYNRPLSALEILTNYNALLNGVGVAIS